MAKLPRVTSVLFGSTGPSTDFGQYGSKAAAAPQTEADYGSLASFIAGCQALAAWTTGWAAAAIGAAFNPFLEDENGAYKVFSYYINQLCERGVSDWDAGTTYYKGALVQDPAGSGQEFFSLTDNNLNNALPLGASNAQWRWNNPPVLTKGASATLNTLPKVSAAAAAGGFAGSVAMADSAVSEDGVDVILGLPLKFADATVQTTAAEPVANQNVVTGARALGVVYQNTSGKTMFVAVSISTPGSTVNQAYTDAALNPLTIVARAGADASGERVTAQMFFIVLPGNYYKVTGGDNLTTWTEWT